MKPSRFSKKTRQYTKWGKNVKEVRTTTEIKQAAVKAAEPNIEVSGNGAAGGYSNFAAVSHSGTEFVLDFFFLQPNSAKAGVKARVISNPVHIKRFHRALAENIRNYEARFGPIADNPQKTGVF